MEKLLMPPELRLQFQLFVIYWTLVQKIILISHLGRPDGEKEGKFEFEASFRRVGKK